MLPASMAESATQSTRPATGREPSALRVAAVLFLILAGALVVSAWLSVLVHQGLAGAEGGVAGFIVEKGPHKVMRRVMTFVVLPFIPLLLREMGWRGRRDCGWSRAPGRVFDSEWKRDLGAGFLIGVLSLGIMIVAARLAGTREPVPMTDWLGELPMVALFAISAVVIAMVEETAVRGVLYRLLERLYRIWPAALASSLLFAYLHFMKADPSVYGDGPVLQETWGALVSAATGPFWREGIAFRFINLSLMGVALCLMVARTRTIWMAAGAHGAWVWVRRLNDAVSEGLWDVPHGYWIGHRSDSTDSAMTSVVLILLAIGVWHFVKPRAEVEE